MLERLYLFFGNDQVHMQLVILSDQTASLVLQSSRDRVSAELLRLSKALRGRSGIDDAEEFIEKMSSFNGES